LQGLLVQHDGVNGYHGYCAAVQVGLTTLLDLLRACLELLRLCRREQQALLAYNPRGLNVNEDVEQGNGAPDNDHHPPPIVIVRPPPAPARSGRQDSASSQGPTAANPPPQLTVAQPMGNLTSPDAAELLQARGELERVRGDAERQQQAMQRQVAEAAASKRDLEVKLQQSAQHQANLLAALNRQKQQRDREQSVADKEKRDKERRLNEEAQETERLRGVNLELERQLKQQQQGQPHVGQEQQQQSATEVFTSFDNIGKLIWN
jgi:hypothetical protein